MQYIIQNDELKHFGVLGMKWGIRRYQPYSINPRKSGKTGVEKGEAAKKNRKERALQFGKKALKTTGKVTLAIAKMAITSAVLTSIGSVGYSILQQPEMQAFMNTVTVKGETYLLDKYTKYKIKSGNADLEDISNLGKQYLELWKTERTYGNLKDQISVLKKNK